MTVSARAHSPLGGVEPEVRCDFCCEDCREHAAVAKVPFMRGDLDFGAWGEAHIVLCAQCNNFVQSLLENVARPMCAQCQTTSDGATLCPRCSACTLIVLREPSSARALNALIALA